MAVIVFGGTFLEQANIEKNVSRGQFSEKDKKSGISSLKSVSESEK
jgi:hypothetical protein